MPVCVHEHQGDGIDIWWPSTVLHGGISAGPPTPDPQSISVIALHAYTNAWVFFSYTPWCNWSALLLSLIALDGMRVCLELLDDRDLLWILCVGFKPFLKNATDRNGNDRPGKVADIITEVGQRVGRSEGRLQPVMAGRDQARRRLERELNSYWEYVPQRVKDDLVTAEYKSQLLKDPSYDPWDLASNYCLAVERLLNLRIGQRLDAYLDEVAADERTAFQKRFLNGGAFRVSGLTVHQYDRFLRDEIFRQYLSKAGLESRYVIEVLPKDLKAFLPFRKQAHHPAKKALTEKKLMQLRKIVLDSKTGIVPMLSKQRIHLGT